MQKGQWVWMACLCLFTASSGDGQERVMSSLDEFRMGYYGMVQINRSHLVL